MSSWSATSVYTADNTLASGGSISSTENNTHRDNVNDLFVAIVAEGLASERHHDGSAAPDDTNDGVIWSDSANALHKLRQAAAWESIATNSNTLTLTNKTLTSPAISGPSFTGVASFADGTAAAPSITNTGDTDTGLFFAAANAIGFAAFGVEPMRITVTTNLTDAVVAILSTEESTSPTTGALTVGDGLGVAGAAWIGGLLNVAGAVTFQSTLGLATANVTGTPTVTGAWTFEANQTIRRASADLTLALETYSATITQRSIVSLRKSTSASLGTKAETIAAERLGMIEAQGVNTALAFTTAANIDFLQKGAAGAAQVGGEIRFLTATASAAAVVRAMITSQGNLLIGANSADPTNGVNNIKLDNTSTVLGAATANSASLACVDIAGGNAALMVQPELGARFALGDSLYIGTAAPARPASLLAGFVVTGSTAASGNPTDGIAAWAEDTNGAGTRGLAVLTESGTKFLLGGQAASRTLSVGGLDAISYVDATGTAGTDNTAQTVKSITLAADSCTAVGRGIRIRVVYTTTGTTVRLTLKLNGQTVKLATALAASEVGSFEVVVHYTAATTGLVSGTANAANTASTVGAALTSLDWTATQAILVSQDAVVGEHAVVNVLAVEQIG